MPVWRRILCIGAGNSLLYLAATILLPEIENGIFLLRLSLAGFTMGGLGAALVTMGAFPRLTESW